MLSHRGYVKTVPVDQFRTQGRGGKGVRGGNLRDEDFVEHLLTSTAHSYLLFFSNRGRVYRLRAHEIPLKDRTARGTALVNLVALQPDEHIEAIIDTRTYEDGAYLFFATRNGMVKKTRMSEYDSSLRTGLIAINLNDGDELVRVIQTSGNDDVFMVSRQGMTIRFSEGDVRPMGRATAGVRGMKLKNTDDGVVSSDIARDDAVLLFVSSSGHGKRTRLAAFNRQGRGGQGVRGMRVTEARGRVVAAFTVVPGDEILLFSSAGNLVRTATDEISEQGRDATGVRVARVGEGDTVVAVARVLEAVNGTATAPRAVEIAEAVDGEDRPGEASMRAHRRRHRRRRRAGRPAAHGCRVATDAWTFAFKDACRHGDASAQEYEAEAELRASLPPDDPQGRSLVGAEDLDLLLRDGVGGGVVRRRCAVVDRVGVRCHLRHRELRR